jgi:hypothetical protein
MTLEKHLLYNYLKMLSKEAMELQEADEQRVSEKYVK